MCAQLWGFRMSQVGRNPLLSNSAADVQRLIDDIYSDSLLVIERKLGSKLRRHCSADDIFQEAFKRAWRDRERFEWRGHGSFRRWFYTLVDHCILDAVDHQDALKRNSGQLPFEIPTDYGIPVTTTPSRVAMACERKHALKVALEALPEDLREIVWLRRFELIPTRQVADHLGLSLQKTQRRLRQGMTIFREQLVRALGRSATTSARPDHRPSGGGGKS